MLSELVVDSSFNIIVAGQIEWYASHPHALGHETTANNFMENGSYGDPWGYNDAFIRKYDRNGNTLWTHWVGAENDGPNIPDENFTSLAIDNNDNIYIAGTTLGKFNSTSFGDLSNQS